MFFPFHWMILTFINGEDMEKVGVLIADDDPRICAFISSHLSERESIKTAVVHDGQSALEQAALQQPELVILDLSMPIMDGMTALLKLRDWYSGAIMILSATDEEAQKVQALDIGADDYLTKPFGIEELLARVRTLLRRQREIDSVGQESTPLITFGNITADLSSRIVFKDGVEINLTRTEFELLKTLATNKGKIISHRELLQKVWGPEYGGEHEYLRTFIKQLRKKIEQEPSRPKFILTQPGMGYRLVG